MISNIGMLKNLVISSKNDRDIEIKTKKYESFVETFKIKRKKICVKIRKNIFLF